MRGRFITFEGTEGGGKSTQIRILAERLRADGRTVVELREPGGTAVGEEIRHLLKHSDNNVAMTPEAELLLMNASRAQLVRETIRPALERGDIVLCDRFLDSTIAYQGYGRGLDLQKVRTIIDFTVGSTIPDLTLLLHVSPALSETRRTRRAADEEPVRDRMEEADRAFFERVEQGFQGIAAEESRVQTIDASRDIDTVAAAIWNEVTMLLARK